MGRAGAGDRDEDTERETKRHREQRECTETERDRERSQSPTKMQLVTSQPREGRVPLQGVWENVSLLLKYFHF